MNKTQTPGPELKRLDAFVGKWNTTGHIKGNSGTPDVHITGTDTYEWLPGRFFLLHRVDVLIGTERRQSIEVIGFDTQANSYLMHYYDCQGNSGTLQAAVENGTWTFKAASLRFTGRFSDDGKTLSGNWEQLIESQWVHWMVIRLTSTI